MKRIFFLTNLFALFLVPCLAQGFEGIIPLKSTFNDVKKALKVKTCSFPQSIYFLKDFSVTVNFADTKDNKNHKICYKVPDETVTSVAVSYHKPILLSDFGYELKYDSGPFGDINTFFYQNSEKGISVFVNENRFGNKAVSASIFAPTTEQHRKFSYPCNQSPKK